jgi:hypothetical protein
MKPKGNNPLKKYKWLAIFMLLPLLLSSCSLLEGMDFLSGTDASKKFGEYFDGITAVRGEPTVETVPLSSMNLEYSGRDLSTDYDKSSTTRIVFSDSGSTVFGKGAETADKDVTISAAGVYILTGTVKGAVLTIKADAADDVTLVLSGLSLIGKNGTAVDIRSAGSVRILLEGENSLSDSAEDKPTAIGKTTGGVILSRIDLSIGGAGSLALTAYRSHGIFSEGSLTVTGGNYNIYTAMAGLVGEHCVKIGGGTFTIKAEEEGILSADVDKNSALSGSASEAPVSMLGYVYVSGGTFTITSTGDAIRAESAMLVSGGVLELTTGVRVDDQIVQDDVPETMPDIWDIFDFEEDTAKTASVGFTVFSDGLSAGSDLIITGGTLAFNVSNHALYAAGTVSLGGGKLYIEAVHNGIYAGKEIGVSDGIVIIPKSRTAASGMNVNISGGYIYVGTCDVGVYAKEHLRITEGVLAVAGSNELPLDFEVATVTGGVLVALGNADVAREFFPTGQRGVILTSFAKQGAGYPLSLLNSDGEIILSLEGTSEYSCAYISAPEIIRDNVYTLVTGGYVSDANRYGFAMNAGAPIGAEPLAIVTAD